jgi:hypothetical protein
MAYWFKSAPMAFRAASLISAGAGKSEIFGKVYTQMPETDHKLNVGRLRKAKEVLYSLSSFS